MAVKDLFINNPVWGLTRLGEKGNSVLHHIDMD
jgi:hypothetical protein